MDRRVLIAIIVLIVIVVLSFFITMAIVSMPEGGGISAIGAANVQVIPVKGPIQAEKSPALFGGPQTTAASILVEDLKKARKDQSVRGVVLEINSPGGTVVASKEIGQAVKDLAEEKPTVAWIREVGASGGYWIASSADWIVADELSVTGSIGVIGSILSFEGLMERYNVSYQRLVSGKYKDAGSIYRDMTPEEMELFQERLDLIHDAFVKEVSANRNIEYDRVRDMATGIFYLGSQAKALDLVDELGGKPEVKSYLKDRLNATEINFIEKKKGFTIFDLLTQGMSQAFFSMGRGLAYEMKNTEVDSEIKLLI